MSQENGPSSKSNKRRESILKTQIIEAEEFKDRHKRRVSFRNVKEVQIYNTDKNCPDLLHNSPPKKEKINETLGSDGVFTPGRTTLSEISNHSPKNHTMAMFNATAQQQPQSSDSKEPAPKFVIEDDITPPVLPGLDKTSYTAMDMSIASDTSKLDDTLQMFTKSFAPAAATINSTAEMFNNSPPQPADTTSTPHDDTLNMFKSPSAPNRKRVSMSSTMAIFQEEVSPNSTLKMFGEQPNTSSQQDENATVLMFGDTNPAAPLSQEKHNATVNQTVAMDVSAGTADETMEVTQKLERSNIASTTASRENETMDMFGEAMQVEDKDKTLVENSEHSHMENEPESCRVGTSMSILQNNTTVLLTNDVDDSVVAREDVSTKEQDTFNVSTYEASVSVRKPNMNVFGQTMDIFPGSQEYQNVATGGRKSELEMPRRVNVAELLNFSEVSMRLEKTALHDKTVTVQEQTCLTESSMQIEKTLLYDKTDTVSETTHLFDRSTNESMNRTTNLTASAISQSLRCRRRTVNTSIQKVINSPVLTSSQNLSMEEQLSFTVRNSLFDDNCVQLNYLLQEEGGTLAQALRQKTIVQLEASLEVPTAQNNIVLDSLLAELKKKNPQQAVAVETMNGRNLGPVDRDILVAARYEAEAEWYKSRATVANNIKKEMEHLVEKLADKLEDVEHKALFCETRPLIEAEVAQLEEELAMLTSHIENSAGAAEERHQELLRELEEFEQLQTQAKLKILRGELAFAERKLEEQKKMAVLLNAAQREQEENKHLILQKLRNAPRQEVGNTV